jgi:hypothetical protein
MMRTPSGLWLPESGETEASRAKEIRSRATGIQREVPPDSGIDVGNIQVLGERVFTISTHLVLAWLVIIQGRRRPGETAGNREAAVAMSQHVRRL